MNLFVADPHWGVWIVLYFYLGGIAAGAYLLATLLEWFGSAADATVARVAHTIAFPLIALQTPIWVFYRRMEFRRQRILESVNPVVTFIVTVAPTRTKV